MRKIHKLLLQDIILSHEHLYESKSKCGYLTDKDTGGCHFEKSIVFDIYYGLKNVPVRASQSIKIDENRYPYKSRYSYTEYEVLFQIGNGKLFTGQKAIKEMKELLNEYKR